MNDKDDQEQKLAFSPKEVRYVNCSTGKIVYDQAR